MYDDVHARPEATHPGTGVDREPNPDRHGVQPPRLVTSRRRRVTSWLPTRASRAWALVFTLLAVVHLAAHLVVPGGEGLARVSQWSLMPPLAAALWCATPPPRPRLVRLAVVALLCSWTGDVVPDLVPDVVSFLALMALFLGAQVSYVLAFAPYRAHSVLARRRRVVILYLAAYVAIVGTAGATLLPQGGWAVPTAIGIVLYGAVLMTMAVLATGVDRLASAGGVLFLASDSLLGLAQALPGTVEALAPGGHGFAVMLTYLMAQALLVAGVRRRDVGDRS